MEGTYPLPEAQRDRFMMRISMGYPDAAAEVLMLRQRDTVNPLDAITPQASRNDVAQLIAFARRVHVSPAIEEYVVALAQATRVDPALHLGASPRATLQLVRAAKVGAALDGRDYVIPDDVTAVLTAVFAHRLLPARGAQRAGARPVEDALARIVQATPIPVSVRS